MQISIPLKTLLRTLSITPKECQGLSGFLKNSLDQYLVNSKLWIAEFDANLFGDVCLFVCYGKREAPPCSPTESVQWQQASDISNTAYQSASGGEDNHDDDFDDHHEAVHDGDSAET